MNSAGSIIAVGLAGFMAGLAYAHRSYLAALRHAAEARALVVDDRAFILTPLLPAPGRRLVIDITTPAERKGGLVALKGGKPEDAA